MPLGSPQSLITRCPSCATAFRASAEQLSLRHGLVRCGRCSHVFDARANAVDVEPAIATSAAGIESPTTVTEASPDEPLYDATSFIAADDEQLPSDAPASDDQADDLSSAEPAEAAPEDEPSAEEQLPSDTPASDDQADDLSSAKRAEAASEGEASAEEQLPSDAPAFDDQADDLSSAEPAEAASEQQSEEQPEEVAQGEQEPAIEAAAEPGESSTDTRQAGIEEVNQADGDAVAGVEPVRPFAEVLEEARTELVDDHGAEENASATSTDEVQPEDAADGASEPLSDDYAVAPADRAADTDTDTSGERRNEDGEDIKADPDAEVAGDQPVADVPDDRLDPIDTAVAAMPPTADSPRPGVASTVAPLELEFGAPRRAQPGVSKWLGIPGAILLLAALAGQVAYHLRGDLILLFPSVRSVAVQLCDLAGCDLPSPQRVELMSIEASDLQADSINPAVMVLSATLRNRAPFAQAQPALELTLTDAQDQPVARRVIEASDYVIAGIQNGVFPASSELPVKIYFEASAVKATGYRLYLFYP